MATVTICRGDADCPTDIAAHPLQAKDAADSGTLASDNSMLELTPPTAALALVSSAASTVTLTASEPAALADSGLASGEPEFEPFGSDTATLADTGIVSEAPISADKEDSDSIALTDTGQTNFDGPAELPRSVPDTTMPDTTGWTVTEVGASDNLQTAINNAAWNTILKLESGATFSGNFTLPYKAGWSAGKWIIIQSNTALPAAGTRISPTTYGASLARIESNDSDPAIDVPLGTADNAPRNYRLIGLEIGVKSTEATCYSILDVGEKNATDSNLPQNIIVDRCWVHGHDSGTDHRRGVSLNARNAAVIDSYVSEIHSSSQAMGVWTYSTPGPLLVRNNYLSASGSSFFSGGATPSKESHIPSDVTVQKNHMHKETRWKNNNPANFQMLNCLEIKYALRILVEDNVLENSWADAQTGWGIIVKAENQSGGANYSKTHHLTLRYNHIKQVARGINMLSGANTNAGCKYFSVHDNLVECLGGANQWGEGDGYSMGIYPQAGNTQDIHIAHNSLILDEASGRNGILVAGGQSGDFGFVFRDNILTESNYGILGDGTGESLNTWLNRLGGAEPDSCVWTGRSSSVYPNSANNHFPANNAAVKFESYVDGCGDDYALASDSDYKNAGTDGEDIGADIATLNSRTSGVVDEYE